MALKTLYKIKYEDYQKLKKGETVNGYSLDNNAEYIIDYSDYLSSMLTNLTKLSNQLTQAIEETKLVSSNLINSTSVANGNIQEFQSALNETLNTKLKQIEDKIPEIELKEGKLKICKIGDKADATKTTTIAAKDLGAITSINFDASGKKLIDSNNNAISIAAIRDGLADKIDIPVFDPTKGVVTFSNSVKAVIPTFDSDKKIVKFADTEVTAESLGGRLATDSIQISEIAGNENIVTSNILSNAINSAKDELNGSLVKSSELSSKIQSEIDNAKCVTTDYLGSLNLASKSDLIPLNTEISTTRSLVLNKADSSTITSIQSDIINMSNKIPTYEEDETKAIIKFGAKSIPLGDFALGDQVTTQLQEHLKAFELGFLANYMPDELTNSSKATLKLTDETLKTNTATSLLSNQTLTNINGALGGTNTVITRRPTTPKYRAQNNTTSESDL